MTWLLPALAKKFHFVQLPRPLIYVRHVSSAVSHKGQVKTLSLRVTKGPYQRGARLTQGHPEWTLCVDKVPGGIRE